VSLNVNTNVPPPDPLLRPGGDTANRRSGDSPARDGPCAERLPAGIAAAIALRSEHDSTAGERCFERDGELDGQRVATATDRTARAGYDALAVLDGVFIFRFLSAEHKQVLAIRMPLGHHGQS
jgi:hypothetical protein